MPINKFLYFGDFFAIPFAVAVFASMAFANGVSVYPAFAGGLLAGAVGWTFAEYWIHRTLYHRAPWFSQLHDRHHATPAAYIGAPSFLFSGFIVLVAYAPFAHWPAFADGFVCGALIGYAGYMVVHHATHHWTLAPGDWFYAARVRHMAHHYHDETNFGIVTGVWDHVFGTAGRRRNRLDRVREGGAV